MNHTHFNGWDWSELARAWGVYIPESYAGKDMYVFCEKKRLATPEEKAEDAKRTYGLIEEDGTITEKLWSDLFGTREEEHWDDHGYEDFNEYDPVLWYINLAMKKYDGANDTRVIKKMANDIRAFCRALAEQNHTYMTPLWRGLSEIESDWSLINIITMDCPLLPAMWD